VKFSLEEDLGSGDITTELTVDAEKIGSAAVVVKSKGVLSGTEAFIEVFRQLDSKLEITWHYHDGDRINTADSLCIIIGSIASILKGERTALNFLGRLSGTASLTQRFVDAVEGTKAVILDTRKTTPLLRMLEKAAVRHGGGQNHRIGLYDMVLIKDNHEVGAGGIKAALERVIAGNKKGIQIEIEVQSLEQLDQALSYDIDRVLLDNFSLEMIAQAVKITAGRIPLEVSGNVTLESVRQIAETGVDYISIGALTHSAPCTDFSMLINYG
ncbi:carboxylating nicotinate-nucleotide diphosphorylase, partial [bacterium]|nr:carboxylating nicotinate-nucleotide diphosphorylase [bacterium]